MLIFLPPKVEVCHEYSLQCILVPGEPLLQKVHVASFFFNVLFYIRRKALGSVIQQVLHLLLRKVVFSHFWLFFCGFRGQEAGAGH